MNHHVFLILGDEMNQSSVFLQTVSVSTWEVPCVGSALDVYLQEIQRHIPNFFLQQGYWIGYHRAPAEQRKMRFYHVAARKNKAPECPCRFSVLYSKPWILGLFTRLRSLDRDETTNLYSQRRLRKRRSRKK